MNKIWKVVVAIAILAIIAGAGTYFYYSSNSLSGRQAVFLTNGQVYFGYVENPNSRVIKIKDIYYLKTQDLLQPNTDQTDNSKKKVSLVKLGNELHGPTDEMLINRDQILFIETMKDSSKINDAINKSNTNGVSKAK